MYNKTYLSIYHYIHSILLTIMSYIAVKYYIARKLIVLLHAQETLIIRHLRLNTPIKVKFFSKATLYQPIDLHSALYRG